MTGKPYLVVSDVHLGAVPASTERAFREFLAYATRAAEGLLINGDLFDFWFEYRTVIPSKHYRVLAALADTVEAGVPVWFTGGNHDAWGGSFLREQVGIQLIDGPARMAWAGRQVLIAHGDGVGVGDRGYRALRWLIRHPLTVSAFRALHPDFGARIAGRASTTEAKVEIGGEEGRSRSRPIEDWAVEQLRADPTLDLVVAGHAHAPRIVEAEPGRFYVNSGDWIHHFSYVELPPGRDAPLLRYWTSNGHAAG
jgi:UDP-2,3-diacylglucosamine hydrolase